MGKSKIDQAAGLTGSSRRRVSGKIQKPPSRIKKLQKFILEQKAKKIISSSKRRTGGKMVNTKRDSINRAQDWQLKALESPTPTPTPTPPKKTSKKRKRKTKVI